MLQPHSLPGAHLQSPVRLTGADWLPPAMNRARCHDLETAWPVQGRRVSRAVCVRRVTGVLTIGVVVVRT